MPERVLLTDKTSSQLQITMQITRIVKQQRQKDRFSVFVDDTYAFSLSEAGLLKSGITKGQTITRKQLATFKQQASGDSLFNQAVRYLALRPRTVWETKQYLARKKAPPSLVTEILNKLSDIGLLDDSTYVKSFVNTKTLLRPTSRRKIVFELRKKHVKEETIERSLNLDDSSERDAISSIIRSKRRQARYQDDLKLMQYLSRQGFHYSDIKEALKQVND